MTKREAIEILEEVKTLDDSMFAYSQAYNGALDMAIEALKAQEPVNPVVDIDTWICGNCGHALEHQQLLGDNVLLHEQYNYCPECGKAVKWDA